METNKIEKDEDIILILEDCVASIRVEKRRVKITFLYNNKCGSKETERNCSTPVEASKTAQRKGHLMTGNFSIQEMKTTECKKY